jgi:hypothetical protein
MFQVNGFKWIGLFQVACLFLVSCSSEDGGSIDLGRGQSGDTRDFTRPPSDPTSTPDPFSSPIPSPSPSPTASPNEGGDEQVSVEFLLIEVNQVMGPFESVETGAVSFEIEAVLRNNYSINLTASFEVAEKAQEFYSCLEQAGQSGSNSIISGFSSMPEPDGSQNIFAYFMQATSCRIHSGDGCTDSQVSNFDRFALNDDGTCEYEVWGCTDSTAPNYDPAATSDDGQCYYDTLGCTDSSATNYDPEATENDDSCIYEDIQGCTDSMASNYNSEAVNDDGSCEYDRYGCTDSSADNYDPEAVNDDESCEYD